MSEQSFPCDLTPWDWWHERLQHFEICFFRWPSMWGICSMFMYFFLLCIVLHRSLFDVWWGILFITYFHDSFLTWCRIICVMYMLSWFVMFCSEIPLLVDGILMLSSHMFCVEIPVMPCWQDAHHAWVCVILIGVFLTESSYSGTSLGATPTWGNFSLYDNDITSMYIITIDNT